MMTDQELADYYGVELDDPVVQAWIPWLRQLYAFARLHEATKLKGWENPESDPVQDIHDVADEMRERYASDPSAEA